MKDQNLSGPQLTTVIIVLIMISWVAGCVFATTEAIKASDMAAWIQAIFSVVAIAAAIWISQSQRRHDQDAHRVMERNAVIGILVLIERGRALTEAMAGIDQGSASEPMLHSVGVIADKLESLNLIASPSPTLLRCSLHAANYLRVCQARGRERRYGELESFVESLRKSHDQIMKFYGITESDYPDSGSW